MSIDPMSDERVWRALVADLDMATEAADLVPPLLIAGMLINTRVAVAVDTAESSDAAVDPVFRDFLHRLYRSEGKKFCK